MGGGKRDKFSSNERGGLTFRRRRGGQGGSGGGEAKLLKMGGGSKGRQLAKSSTGEGDKSSGQKRKGKAHK